MSFSIQNACSALFIAYILIYFPFMPWRRVQNVVLVTIFFRRPQHQIEWCDRYQARLKFYFWYSCTFIIFIICSFPQLCPIFPTYHIILFMSVRTIAYVFVFFICMYLYNDYAIKIGLALSDKHCCSYIIYRGIILTIRDAMPSLYAKEYTGIQGGRFILIMSSYWSIKNMGSSTNYQLRQKPQKRFITCLCNHYEQSIKPRFQSVCSYPLPQINSTMF